MHLTRRKEKFLFLVLFIFILGTAGISSTGQKEENINHFSPAFPALPFQFRGNRIAVLLFKTTPEALQKLVPKPLMPNPTNLAFIYFSRLTVEYGSIAYPYLEVGIGVPVVYKGMIANFYSLLYLNRTMAVTAGREIWGYPKKGGDITFEIEGKEITGTLDRQGTRLVDFHFTIGEKLSTDPPPPNYPPLCLKIIPSVEKGALPEVKQITTTGVRNHKVHELYKGTGTVTFRSGEFDALAEIPVLQIVSGDYSVSDMVFDYGKVIYDYLKKEENQ